MKLLFGIGQRVDRRTIAWLFGIFVVVLLAVNIMLWIGPGLPTPKGVGSLVRDPIVLTIIGAVVTFLVIDRWRRIETELSDLQSNQTSALRDIREDAKALTSEQTETITRKAAAIESRIGALLEDHPWIADITENEFIPDAGSCRIVLRTAEELLATNRVSLIYEYLFFWAKRDSGKARLEGTADDFFSLAAFCEEALGDEYLAFLVMREGYYNAMNRMLLIPDYLRCSIRCGRFSDTVRVARELKRILIPAWWNRVLVFTGRSNPFRKANFAMRGYAALAVFSAVSGDDGTTNERLDKAKEYARTSDDAAEMLNATAEICTIRGDYAGAGAMLGGMNESTSSENLYRSAQVYRTLGDTKRVQAILAIAESRRVSSYTPRSVQEVRPLQSVPPNVSQDSELDEHAQPTDSQGRRVVPSPVTSVEGPAVGESQHNV